MEKDAQSSQKDNRTEIKLSSPQQQHGAKSDHLNFQFSCDKLPKSVAKKVSHLAEILNSEVINLRLLKEHLAQGIPDEAALLRQFSWKLVLDYLPPQKAKWHQKISQQEATYFSLVQMFLPNQKFEDYPIILKKGHPKFKQLEEDYILWEQIEKDTSRTHAQISFFATESSPIMIPYLTSARRQKFKLINGESEQSYKQFMGSKQKQRKTYRYDYMTRILYIYSRLNPRIQYVQGMNEILAPIFYLVNINKPNNAIEQASCFFMFNNAISDIIELHIKDLDRSQNGIYGRLNQVNDMLVVIQPMIWSRLEKLKIDPFFYCFRWVTLLFAQDFALFDTLRIWQSIFSAEDRIRFINFVAIAIIMNCKQVIVNGQFTNVLQHLQDIQNHINVHGVVHTASELYLQFHDKEFSHHAKQTKKILAKSDQDEEEDEEDKGFFKRIGNFMSEYF